MSLFISASLLPSFDNSLPVLLWATAGGIAVFIGLAIERFADWMDDRYAAPPEKPHKYLESIGWRILMAGIFIEILAAGGTAISEWKANIEYKSKLAEIDLQLTPRFFENWDSYLAKYKQTRSKSDIEAIIVIKPEDECDNLARQISGTLRFLGWKLSYFRPTNDLYFPPPGVTVEFLPGDASSPSEKGKNILLNEAAFDLLHAFTNSGFQATWYFPPEIKGETVVGHIIIGVGERPNRLQSKQLKFAGEHWENMAANLLEYEKTNPIPIINIR